MGYEFLSSRLRRLLVEQRLFCSTFFLILVSLVVLWVGRKEFHYRLFCLAPQEYKKKLISYTWTPDLLVRILESENSSDSIVYISCVKIENNVDYFDDYFDRLLSLRIKRFGHIDPMCVVYFGDLNNVFVDWVETKSMSSYVNFKLTHGNPDEKRYLFEIISLDIWYQRLNRDRKKLIFLKRHYFISIKDMSFEDPDLQENLYDTLEVFTNIKGM